MLKAEWMGRQKGGLEATAKRKHQVQRSTTLKLIV